MADHMTAAQLRAEFEAFMKRRGTPLILEQTQAFESFRAGIECAARIYGATPALTRDAIADLVEGMSVSVDVSTCEDDAGHRYFGTVTEAMHDPDDKHGLTLLVQNAEPNFVAARLSGMAAVVPEGYKLVPLTPTLEMQRAYFNSIDKHMDRVQKSPCFGRHENQRIAYAQMLAAAPEPPHV